MKSPTVPTPVTTNLSAATTQRLTVRADAKLFNLLADKVYTDKVKAVIRETWSNALDSHVAAGQTAKFVTTLPTRLDPVFRVRDFGVGMSHETVLGLYSELMSSSKDDDNTQVGFLGIGSKSPLAISDAFTVTCYDGVEQRSYLISIDAQGGVITELGTVPSTEPRGVEVKVPVPESLIGEFGPKAAEIAVGFGPDAPTGLRDNGSGADVLSGAYLADEGVLSWRIVSGHDVADGANIVVRQGPVLYPVSDYTLTDGSGVRRWSSYQLIVDIPLGTADVSPDRESLSLDFDTKANLARLLQAAYAAVDAAADAQVEAAGNWLARISALTEQAAWRTTADSVPSLYVTGESVPTFLSGKKWGKHVGTPADTNSHPLAPADSRVPAVRFYAAKASAAVFYVLRPGIVRAADRVKRDAALRADRQGNFTAYVLDNPTNRQVEALYRLLGLSRDQIVPVASIIDVPPPKKERTSYGSDGRSQRSSGGLSGVYDLTGSIVTLADSLPSDYLWVRSDSRAADFKVRVYSNVYSEQSGVSYSAPLADLGLPTTVVGFSPKAVETYNPDPRKELHVAVDNAVSNASLLSSVALDIALTSALRSLQYSARSTLSAPTLRSLLQAELPAGTECAEVPHRSDYFWRSVTTQYREASEALASDAATAVREKYPLLFQPTVDQVEAYIAEIKDRA
jgi:hypothetical protein